jgi:predicted amidohydrolase YtcJ
VTNDIIDLLMKLYAENKLSINNILLLSSDSTTLAEYALKGLVKKNNLKIAGIKVYGDGSLGSRGACLLKDYSDMPGHRGTIITPMDKIGQIADLAKAHNFQLCTHAIGDSTNRAILRLYGQKLQKTNDLRWRIEHAQVVDYQDIDMFKTYSIVPSVQPTHATSDAPWVDKRLGKERLPEAYAYKQLLVQNGWLPLGTDFPVEQINPINTFYAAVFRKDTNGNPGNGFQKENALTRQEALRGITIWAAKSVFLEKTKGSIAKGKDADLVIMDTDIMTAPEKEILKAKTTHTILNGKIVYAAK